MKSIYEIVKNVDKLDLSQTDPKGNNVLHHIALKVKDLDEDWVNVVEIVLNDNPSLFDQSNMNGETPRSIDCERHLGLCKIEDNLIKEQTKKDNEQKQITNEANNKQKAEGKKDKKKKSGGSGNKNKQKEAQQNNKDSQDNHSGELDPKAVVTENLKKSNSRKGSQKGSNKNTPNQEMTTIEEVPIKVEDEVKFEIEQREEIPPEPVIKVTEEIKLPIIENSMPTSESSESFGKSEKQQKTKGAKNNAKMHNKGRHPGSPNNLENNVDPKQKIMQLTEQYTHKNKNKSPTERQETISTNMLKNAAKINTSNTMHPPHIENQTEDYKARLKKTLDQVSSDKTPIKVEQMNPQIIYQQIIPSTAQMPGYQNQQDFVSYQLVNQQMHGSPDNLQPQMMQGLVTDQNQIDLAKFVPINMANQNMYMQMSQFMGPQMINQNMVPMTQMTYHPQPQNMQRAMYANVPMGNTPHVVSF